MRFTLVLFIATLICGCKSEDPEPQLRDPIFKVLSDQASQAKSAYDSQIKKVEDAAKALEKTDANTLDRKLAIRDLASSTLAAKRLAQDMEYYRIRAERRRLEARKSYKIAFNKDQDWPNPAEFEAYQASKRLREAPRSWDHRVPKLNDRILAAWPKVDPKKKKEKKEEKKSEEGE